MDRNRFDIITRELTTTNSRRAALKALTAVGLGLAVARLGSSPAVAKGKKSLSARCKKSDECKGSLVCQKANAENGCFPATEKRCCVKLGGSCNDGCDCCGVGVICNGGFCKAT